MSQVNSFIQRLDTCPIGRTGWVEFESICTEILSFLFVPPLINPKIQPRTFSGIERRDAIFPNRNITQPLPTETQNWYHFFIELQARLILFEFKNYDKSEIGKEEVNQTRNYLNSKTGRLAFIICSKEPEESAFIMRNKIFNEEKKVILFITKEQLKEILYMKDRNEEPSDFLMDLLEYFYIQHE
jgi:hypothetical protein